MSVSPKERTIDYNVSDVSLLEKIRTLGEGILLAAALNYLFYESLPACIPLLPVPFLYARMRKKKAAADRRQRRNLWQNRNLQQIFHPCRISRIPTML